MTLAIGAVSIGSSRDWWVTGHVNTAHSSDTVSVVVVVVKGLMMMMWMMWMVMMYCCWFEW